MSATIINLDGRAALAGYDSWKTRAPEEEPLDAEVADLPDAIRERYEERVTEAAGEGFDSMDPIAAAFLNEQPEDVRNELARWAVRFALNSDMSADDHVQRLCAPLREAFIAKHRASYTDGPWELALEELIEHREEEARENYYRMLEDNARDA